MPKQYIYILLIQYTYMIIYALSIICMKSWIYGDSQALSPHLHDVMASGSKSWGYPQFSSILDWTCADCPGKKKHIQLLGYPQIMETHKCIDMYR